MKERKPFLLRLDPALYESLERWAEFMQRGQVKGREVVSIVPAAEAKVVAKDAPPRAGASKVQMLRGNEYMRVWFNKGGNLYLIHLATGAAEKPSSANAKPYEVLPVRNK